MTREFNYDEALMIINRELSTIRRTFAGIKFLSAARREIHERSWPRWNVKVICILLRALLSRYTRNLTKPISLASCERKIKRFFCIINYGRLSYRNNTRGIKVVLSTGSFITIIKCCTYNVTSKQGIFFLFTACNYIAR